MPGHLKRYYSAKHLHFITCSCYHRLPMLGTPQRRDLFLQVLEQVRQRYRFVVVGYVVMAEHIHILISEPEKGDPSVGASFNPPHSFAKNANEWPPAG